MFIHKHTTTKARRQSGFTLVEVMISLTVLTVAVYLMSSTITATMAHSAQRKERTLALESAMNVLEAMRAVPFEDLSRLYNEKAGDDPDGAGTGPGATFEVPDLTAQSGAVNGAQGFVKMPLVNGNVFENVVMPELGMPRDLNGDFVVDAGNHSKDYTILPVEVRIEWQGSSGPSHLEIKSMFSAVQKQLK